MAAHPTSELLSPAEFRKIGDLAFRTCGIDLGEGKRQLVQARLGKKIRQGKFASFDEYYRHVVADETGLELTALLDALTTNFTSFLREAAHFDFLRQLIVPHIDGPIRIWSAACSSGEEPFTIAFSLLEELGMGAAGRMPILAPIFQAACSNRARRADPAERFDAPRIGRHKYLYAGKRALGRMRIASTGGPAFSRFRRINLIEPFHSPRLFHIILPQHNDYFDKDAGTARQWLAGCLEPGGQCSSATPDLNGLTHRIDRSSPTRLSESPWT